MAPEVYDLAQTAITSHAFSADRRQLAVSLNCNDIQIYSKAGQEWSPTETLSEHDNHHLYRLGT